MKDVKTLIKMLELLKKKLKKYREDDSGTYTFYEDLQYHLRGLVDAQVIKPPFTKAEISDLETLIRDNEDEGSYYGNKKHYEQRRENIKYKLAKLNEVL